MRFDRLVLIVLLLVLPVAFWPGSTSYDAIKFTLLGLAGACWLGNLALRAARGLSITRPPSLLLLAGISLLAVLGISAGGAAQPNLVFRTFLLTTLWLAVTFQTAVLGDTSDRMGSTLTAMITAGVITSLYGLIQIGGWLPGAPTASGFPPGISTLGNQNYLSGLAAVLFWPSILLWRQPSVLRRSVFVSATIILAVTIILAGAVGPLAGVIGSCFLVLPSLALVRLGRSRLVPLVLGATLLLTAILGLGLLREAMRPSPQTPDEALSIHRKIWLENHGDIRRTNWLVARQMIQSSRWTGRGGGNYSALWPIIRAELQADPAVTGLAGHEPLAARAHNEVFQFLGETGLVGAAWLMLVGAAGIWFWRRRWQRLIEDRLRTDFLLLGAGLMVAVLHGSVSFPLHLPATALVLAVVTGLVASPVFAGPSFSPAVWSGNRLLAVLPALMALALLAGSLREFVGDLHIATGRRYFTAADLGRADTHLAKGTALCRWPGHGNLFHGLTLMAAGDISGAERLLAAGLAEKPTFEGYLALAEIQIDQGEFESASRNLTIVEDCRPVMAFRFQTAYLRGLADLRLGNHDEARRRWMELLKMDSENQRAWLALGYLEMLAKKPEQARSCYSRALEIIDRKLGQSAGEGSNQAIGAAVRLNRHRQTAVRALESVP